MCRVQLTYLLITILLFSFLIFVTVSGVLYAPVLVFNKTVLEGGYLYCSRDFPWAHGELVFYLFILLATYGVPLSVIMFCYVQILYQVWHKTSAGTESAQANARALRRKKKITRMVFIVVTLFALCWAPLHAVNLGLQVAPNFESVVSTEFYTFCLCLAYANSCVNPFVYAFTTTSFKKYFKKFFSSGWSGKTPRENVSVSISMKTKTERLTTSQTREDSSI